MDDVRTFYEGAADAVDAFVHRLCDAGEAPSPGRLDYGPLLRALDLIPPRVVEGLVARLREPLIAIARDGSAAANPDGAALWQRIATVARRIGDSDLAAYGACSSLRHLVRSVCLPLDEVSRLGFAVRMSRDDPGTRRDARATAALTLGGIALSYGRLKEALTEARAARRLSKAPRIAVRVALLIGDVHLARGMFGLAESHYEQAVHLGSVGEASSGLRETAIARWISVRIEAGRTSAAISDARTRLSQLFCFDTADPLRLSLTLELAGVLGHRRAVALVAHLCALLKRSRGSWLVAGKLSLSTARAMLRMGECGSMARELDYVIRISGHCGTELDMALALSLSAEACWAEGRLAETLAAVRMARSIHAGQRPGVRSGSLTLLRAKVAFYRGEADHAVTLVKRAMT